MELTILLINGGIVLFYIMMFFMGYKKGFVLQLIDLIGLIAIIYIAWLFSPVLATYFSIWPKDLVPLQVSIFQDAIYGYINQFAWFIVIFIVLKLILMVLRPLIKVLQNIPILKQVNSICGALFSLLYSTVWMILIAFVLTLPILPNGNHYVTKTWLQPILTSTSTFISGLEEPLSKNNALSNIVDNMNELSDNDREALKDWFEENHLDEVGN
ncbi:CvpA family protein [Anaerorhabdus furcosa]|uniref:Uncharacterized membrane protein, required for colicin V production n=1 Tax=Anaerorhabdus furcosa TaxID=118967 RepID=A0A1T4QDT4_9FIRM|nr:CvpA family protein [Anaerorhabdus furcosa]SKA01892.1 Uncharacterized membrane protein, required for colicin V production [Anaerorhabdus furcosa]